MKKLLLFFLLISFNTFSQNIIIKHKNYTTTFSTTLKYPLVVEWWLTKAKLCNNKRINGIFRYDPYQKQYTNLVNDYNGCGVLKIDRGHMCPSDDNRCSDSLQIECCYYSNIAPQYSGLNRGEWLLLENLTRIYAEQNDSIHIWAGSIGVSDSMKSVKIPKQCWKVLYIKKENKYIAYLFNNDNSGDGDITNNIVSIDIIEKLTGYKFK